MSDRQHVPFLDARRARAVLGEPEDSAELEEPRSGSSRAALWAAIAAQRAEEHRSQLRLLARERVLELDRAPPRVIGGEAQLVERPRAR